MYFIVALSPNNLVAIFIPCIQETTCKLEGQQHNNNQQRDNSSSGVTGGGSCVATSAEQSRASLRTRATSGESGDTAETRTLRKEPDTKRYQCCSENSYQKLVRVHFNHDLPENL